MGTRIVSKETIDAIITYAVSGERVTSCRCITNPLLPAATSAYSPSQIGQALWHENHLSVNYRLKGDVETPVYAFTPLDSVLRPDGRLHKLGATEIIKCVLYLAYHCCDHPGWGRGFTSDFLDRVRSVAIFELPGFAEAAWDLAAEAPKVTSQTHH